MPSKRFCDCYGKVQQLKVVFAIIDVSRRVVCVLRMTLQQPSI
jgi:hypothetical protein